MMKARQYDRRLLTRGIQPNIYSIRESNGIQAMTIEYFHKDDPKLKADIESIVTEMRDAKEYGSILNITPVDFAGLYARFDEIRNDINMMQMSALDELQPLVKCAELLAQKYDVVVTNPPYMAVSNAGAKVNNYVKKNFPDSKADLFAVFIERCGQMVKKNGYQAMITQHAWMFLSSFEKLRTKLLAVDIVNMAHLGARAFEEIGGEVVQTTSFVIRKSHIADYKGEYCRLIEPTSQQGKEDMFLSGENRYAADQSNFSKIPGSPVAYWVSKGFQRLFSSTLGDVCDVKKGSDTGNNDRYVRNWWEVDVSKADFKCHTKKWIPYIKGGEARKWFGHLTFLVNWDNNGLEIRNEPKATVRNEQFFYREGITWSDVGTNSTTFRFFPSGCLRDNRGPAIFARMPFYVLGLLNSPVSQTAQRIVNPTICFQAGSAKAIPYIEGNSVQIQECTDLTAKNVDISHNNWDSYETSWDFKRNPLV